MRASAMSALASVWLAAAPAAASAPDVFGFGARGVALSSALTSTATGFAATYYNPAGLGLTRGVQVAAGYQRADYFMQIDGRPESLGDAGALVLGLAIPLPFLGPLADRLTVGLGFVMPQTSILVADIPAPGVPRFVRLDRRFETVSIMGAVGVRILDGLAVGVGFLALAELVGAIDVAPNEAGRIGAKVKDELIADYSLIAGVMVAPLDELTLGLTFRQQSDAEYALPLDASLGDRFPLPIPTIQVAGTAQFDPLEVSVGATYRPIPGLRLMAEAAFEAWSQYPNPVEFSATPDDFPAQPAPEFTDVVSARLGAELDLRAAGFRLEPRLGLSFQPSPVPRQEGFHNYLDAHLVGGSAGLAVRRWGFQLELALTALFSLPRQEVKDLTTIPTGLPVRVDDTIAHSGVALGTSVEVGAEF